MAAQAADQQQQQAMFERQPEPAGYAPMLNAGLMHPHEQLNQVGPPLMLHHAQLTQLGLPAQQAHPQQQPPPPPPTGLQMGGHMHQFQR